MAKMVLTLHLMIFSSSLSNYTSYKDFVVFQVIPRNNSDIEFLATLEDQTSYDFWSEIRTLNYPISIMVKPQDIEKFTTILRNRKLQYHRLIQDVSRVILREHEALSAYPKITKGKISFKIYHKYPDILNYLEKVSVDNPDTAKMEVYGYSYEGRALIALRIGNGSWTNPTIFIDSGMHAREWITPAVSLYIIKQLVENKNNQKLVHNCNWAIIPVANPDGYEYSHTADRLWRKTRSCHNDVCYGVDPYRNFDYQWSSSSNDDQCSSDYPGKEPFSEVETKAFRDFALGTENIALYLTLHSIGKWINYPWGYNKEPPMNWKELQFLGESVAKAIKSVNGTEYATGPITRELGKPTFGTSKDWMMGVIRTRLSYAIELPGGDDQGFDPPINRIMSVCQETWAGIKEFHKYVIQDVLLDDI